MRRVLITTLASSNASTCVEIACKSTNKLLYIKCFRRLFADFLSVKHYFCTLKALFLNY